MAQKRHINPADANGAGWVIACGLGALSGDED